MSLTRIQFVLALAVVAIALVALFQFFLRYDYIHSGQLVTRVDRLTGRSCVLPCPESTPTPPAPNLEHQEQRAIAAVRSDYQALRITSAVGFAH
jgi:hypothetical protein